MNGLTAPSFRTDRPGTALVGTLETRIGEAREKELSDLGFIAACECQDTAYAAFFANPSIQEAKTYDDELATVNARMSAMLQYILCALRFAHYVKVMGREKMGSVADAGALEAELQTWIKQYVAQATDASPSLRARYPLQDAAVEVRDHPGEPGHFLAELYLSPHCQLDELTASVKLVAGLRKE